LGKADSLNQTVSFSTPSTKIQNRALLQMLGQLVFGQDREMTGTIKADSLHNQINRRVRASAMDMAAPGFALLFVVWETRHSPP